MWGGVRFESGYIEIDSGMVYDLATQTWTDLPLGGPSPRRNPVAVWTGSEAIVFGGEAGGVDLDGMIYRP